MACSYLENSGFLSSGATAEKSNESHMSPCSHAQQHGRRSLANGRQTSSAVSVASLRAAQPQCCHGLSWPRMSCHWLHCGLNTCAHTTLTPSKRDTQSRVDRG